jgi:hypothetical protein
LYGSTPNASRVPIATTHISIRPSTISSGSLCVRESRPNPLGLPDLIKPEGWEAPSHEGNHGKFNDI